MGAINAAMYLLATRAVRSGQLPGGAEVWVVAVGLAYAAASVLLRITSPAAIRPARLRAWDAPRARARGPASWPSRTPATSSSRAPRAG